VKMDSSEAHDHRLLKRAFLVELEQQQTGPKVYCRAKHRHYVPAVPTLQRMQDFSEVRELSQHADKLIASKGLTRPTRAQQWLLPAVAAGFDTYVGKHQATARMTARITMPGGSPPMPAHLLLFCNYKHIMLITLK
jgi:hypothetical protein